MLRLCRKDFVASRWFWLLALIVYLLYSVFSIKQDAAFMVMAVAFLLSLAALPLIIEDHYRTEIFFCSLPVDRSTIVGARYLLSGFIILIGGLLVFSYRYLLYSIVKINDLKISPFPLLTLEELSGFVTLAAFLTCLFYPLYFRYGLAKGAFLLTLIFLALLIAASGIRVLAPWLGARDLFTLHSLARVKDLLGPPLFLLGAVAINLAVIFFSIRLSVRSYNQRDF